MQWRCRSIVYYCAVGKGCSHSFSFRGLRSNFTIVSFWWLESTLQFCARTFTFISWIEALERHCVCMIMMKIGLGLDILILACNIKVRRLYTLDGCLRHIRTRLLPLFYFVLIFFSVKFFFILFIPVMSNFLDETKGRNSRLQAPG